MPPFLFDCLFLPIAHCRHLLNRYFSTLVVTNDRNEQFTPSLQRYQHPTGAWGVDAGYEHVRFHIT